MHQKRKRRPCIKKLALTTLLSLISGQGYGAGILLRKTLEGRSVSICKPNGDEITVVSCQGKLCDSRRWSTKTFKCQTVDACEPVSKDSSTLDFANNETQMLAINEKKSGDLPAYLYVREGVSLSDGLTARGFSKAGSSGRDGYVLYSNNRKPDIVKKTAEFVRNIAISEYSQGCPVFKNENTDIPDKGPAGIAIPPAK